MKFFRFPIRNAAALALALSAGARAASFQEVGAGARAPRNANPINANAFTAIANDVFAVHYNPAGLALLQRPELGTSYTQLLLGLGDNSTMSHTFVGYAHPLPGANRGVLGSSWEQFALNGGYYQEHAFTLAYGRLLSENLGPGKLYAGLSAKALYRSFGALSEAGNAKAGIFATGQSDPSLTRATTVVRPDADLGLLYKMLDHYTVGLSAAHVARPDVAFNPNDSDVLPLTLRAGLNYGSLLSNIGVEYETRRAPVGGQDHLLSLAVERWFLGFWTGDVGFRGGLNEGTRNVRSFTTGLTYRARRFSVDYAFSMPINAVSSIAGSHRVAFSLRFGSPRDPDESVVMILEAMRQLKKGVVPELRALGQGLSSGQKAVLGEYLGFARSLEAQAKYQEALEQLNKAIAVSPADTELLKSFGRLNWVASQVKALPDYRVDPAQEDWHQGILAYLAFNDPAAVEKVSRAAGLKPDDKALEEFLAALEGATGIKRTPPDTAGREGYQIAQKLAKASLAIEEGRYEEAVALAREVLAADPVNASAWEDLGTAFFATGDYQRSLEAWQRAFALERNSSRRAALRGYIDSIRRIQARRPKAPEPQEAEARPVKPAASPEEIQRLYNEGVDAYTSGKLDEAKAYFQEVIRADPAYVPASKALKRVIEEQAPK